MSENTVIAYCMNFELYDEYQGFDEKFIFSLPNRLEQADGKLLLENLLRSLKASYASSYLGHWFFKNIDGKIPDKKLEGPCDEVIEVIFNCFKEGLGKGSMYIRFKRIELSKCFVCKV